MGITSLRVKGEEEWDDEVWIDGRHSGRWRSLERSLNHRAIRLLHWHDVTQVLTKGDREIFSPRREAWGS